MTTDDFVELKAQLILHEGMRARLYKDTVGKWTIGVGRNLSDRGLSQDEIMLMLENDIAGIVGALNQRFPWFPTLDPMRQRVLIDMGMMGVEKLAGFHKMLDAVRTGDYQRAADEMLRSKWAGQVGKRAQRLAAMMRDGKPADEVILT